MISTEQRRRAWLDGIARLLDWRGTLNTTYYIPPRKRSPKAELDRHWATVGTYFDAVLEDTSADPVHERRLTSTR
jgi:hypothetical protein